MRHLVPLLVVALAGCSSPDPCHRTAALEAANEFALARLKAPATATFPEPDGRHVVAMRETTDKGQCAYSISSYVDSENSYGAKIRETFLTHVYLTDEGQWELDGEVLFLSDVE